MERESRHRSLFNGLIGLVSYHQPCRRSGQLRHPYRRPAQERTPLSGANTSLYVFAILAAFTILGSFILDMFHLELPAIQIAGGFVVAHSGYRMLVPASDHGDPEAHQDNDIAFTPMALPLIAGPGAIGEVIGLSARYTEPRERLAILIAVLVISIVIMALLRWCTPLVHKLGPGGILGLTRIMGFIILCIGVELMIHGVSTLAIGL